MRASQTAVTLLAFVGLAGCASVSVKKVPTPAADGVWCKESEKMEGLRFYRPRPYVAVKQRFPLGGSDFFLTGTVNDQGDVIDLDVDPAKLPKAVEEQFKLVGGTASLSVRQVRAEPSLLQGAAGGDKPPKAGDAAGGQPPAKDQTSSGTAADKKKKDEGADGKKKDGEAAEGDAEPANKTEAKTKANIITGGDPATSPKLEVNNFFDVVYLPDFTEQYVIKATAGLGSANADVGLENGWMLERSQLSIDNSLLGQFIFSNIEKFIDIAVDIAKAALNPVEMLVPDPTEEPSATQPAALQGLSTQKLAKRKVVLRVRYSLEAQPGLYPILKPWERTIEDACHPDKRETFKTYVHLPYRPYTVIAYNVRKTVLIELVNISAPPAAEPNDNPPAATNATKVPMQNAAGATLLDPELIGNLNTQIAGSNIPRKPQVTAIRGKEPISPAPNSTGFDKLLLTISSEATSEEERAQAVKNAVEALKDRWAATTFEAVHQQR